MAGKPTLGPLGIVLGCCCALWSGAGARAQEADISVLAGREQILAAYDRMPRAQIERVFMRCDASSRDTMLGFEEGVVCAMAWDALLKREFDGDVEALLAWWRAQGAAGRAEPTAQTLGH